MKTPKVSRRTLRLDGKMVTITMVRASKLCRWFSSEKIVVIGHTLYCADAVVRPKDMFRALGKLNARRSWLDKIINLMYF